MSNFPTLVVRLKTRLNDNDAILKEYEIDDALNEAVVLYSMRRPRRAVHEITGDGTTKTFAVPADWVSEWSEILLIESIDATGIPSEVDPGDYAVEQTTSAYQFRFLVAPSSGITYRIRYTTTHTLTSTTTSIPGNVHQRAVSVLGAAIASEWIATHYAAQTDSSFTVDVSDHAGRATRYQNRSDSLRAQFDRMVPEQTDLFLQVVRT